MDDDTSDLIAQLCTRIGMTMEDASVVALTVAGMDRDDRRAVLEKLDIAARQISAFVKAARVLLA